MADAKLSSFGAATVLAATDLIPILQTGTNKIATLGQIKSFAQTPSSATVAAGTISLLPLVYISGACTLPVGLVDGTRILIYGIDTGTISSVGLLPSDGFRFVLGDYVELFWASTKWNVLVNSGMLVGLV